MIEATDDQIDDLLDTLDDIASDFGPRKYGLPIGYSGPSTLMRSAVRDWLAGLPPIVGNDRTEQIQKHASCCDAHYGGPCSC